LDVNTLVQHNWDYDNVAGAAGMTITTPSRVIVVPTTDVSGDDEEKTSSHTTLDIERGTTWIVSGWVQSAAVPNNLVTFWTTDQNGVPMAIFARSTNIAPP
jgi:hypothetical protein